MNLLGRGKGEEVEFGTECPIMGRMVVQREHVEGIARRIVSWRGRMVKARGYLCLII